MSSHESLSAASTDRKARLAQLNSLKRKQPSSSSPAPDSAPTQPAPSVTSTYLSGRNFDPTTRNVKLGFDNTPIADPTATVEYQASQLALESHQAQAAESADALDLFKLQPKRPNWDLKRDLREKMRGLDRRTEGAVARAVRERVEAQRGKDGDGVELVGAMKVLEREGEREREREEREEMEEEGEEDGR